MVLSLISPVLFQALGLVAYQSYLAYYFCGAMENRTPIYDLQNHCNSRYTIAPNATCLLASQANPLMADFVAPPGVEPDFYG